MHSGRQGGGAHGLVRSALGPDASPVPEMCDLGEEGGHTLEQPLQEGTLASKDSVPTPQVHRRKAEGEIQPGRSGSAHGGALSSSRRADEGLGGCCHHSLRCVEADPVSLCFRARKAGEARSQKPVSAQEATQ